jgi:hypothetical protein
MAKFDGVVGRRLLTVDEKPDELTLIFEDNRFLIVTLKDGKLNVESIPE